MNLFTTLWNEKNPERRAELHECLLRNLESELFEAVYVLVEGDVFPFPALADATNLVVEYIDRRQTFDDLFGWVNRVTGPNDVNAICNSDIYFDDSLLLVETQSMKDVCMALSRWDVAPSGTSTHHVSIDSQDAWIFRGKIKDGISADFGPGIAGTDNALAHRLNWVGYDVQNPSKTIKAHHLHNSGVRNYDPEQRVSGQYLLIEPTFLEIL